MTLLTSRAGLLRPVAADPAINRAGLKNFRLALGARASTPVDILAIGDSKTEGSSAPSVDLRWQERLTAQLRDRYQPAGIEGGRYLPAYWNAGISYPVSMTLAGGAAVHGINVGGLGNRAVKLTGTGQTITFTVAAGTTDVDVFYLGFPGGGRFTWQVDDGTVSAPVNTSVAPQRDGQRVQITGLAPETGHTITLAWSSGGGGTSYIHGHYAYRGDKTLGIRMWDDGQGGSTTRSWAGANPGVNGLLNNQAGAIRTIDPDLVIIDLMTNDFTAGSPTIGPAASRTNLAAMVSVIRTETTAASILLAVPFQRVGTSPSGATWPAYVAAVETLARQLGLALWYGDRGLYTGDPLPAAFTSDQVHPKTAGHQMWADDLFALLTQSFGVDI